MVVCGRHHLWQPCLNLAHAPHGRLIDGQGRRPVRRPITAIHRLAGGTEAFEIPLGFRCEPVKHALVDITHLLSTESQELAKTAHACAQAKGACPHTRRGGGGWGVGTGRSGRPLACPPDFCHLLRHTRLQHPVLARSRAAEVTPEKRHGAPFAVALAPRSAAAWAQRCAAVWAPRSAAVWAQRCAAVWAPRSAAAWAQRCAAVLARLR